MPAIVRIDFDVHAEAISKALQAELAKVQGVVASVNTVIEQSHAASTKKIVQTSIQEEQKGLVSIQALRQKVEQEITQMREGFSAKVWGSEKQAATAIVSEIKKLQEAKEQNIYLLKKGNLDKEQADFIKSEQTKVELSLKTMHRIALENVQIRERGAGAEVGIMGQGRNLDEINIKATKLKTLFASGLGIAAVAVSMGIFSKSTGEAVDQVASVATAGLGMAATIAGAGKALLTATQAQKLFNLAMAAAPWVAVGTAIVLVITYFDEIVGWFKKAYVSVGEFLEGLGAFRYALELLVLPISLLIRGVTAIVGLFTDDAPTAVDTTTEAIAKQARTVDTAINALNRYKQTLAGVVDYNMAEYFKALDEGRTKDAAGWLALAKIHQTKLNAQAAREEQYYKDIGQTKESNEKEHSEKSVKIAKDTADKIITIANIALRDLPPILGGRNKVGDPQKFVQSNVDFEIYQLELRKIKGQINEQQFQDAVYKIKLQGLKDQLALLDVYSNEYAAMLDRITQLERDHNIEVAKRTTEAPKLEESLANQIKQYTEIGQSVFSLIGGLKDLSKIEHQRDKEADKRLENQLAAHERMSEANAGLAKDEKEAQKIRKKGEDQRADLIRQREDEEEAAAEKEEAAAARQNTQNLLSAASAMVLAVANAIASGATGGPLALALIPAITSLALATFASAKSGLGFEIGGYTGKGRNDEPAGIVHKNEFVLPAGSFAVDSGGNLIGIKGGDVVESLRIGGFASKTDPKGGDVVESLRIGGFASAIENQNDILRQLIGVMSQKSGRRSRLMLQRSLNRESV